MKMKLRITPQGAQAAYEQFDGVARRLPSPQEQCPTQL